MSRAHETRWHRDLVFRVALPIWLVGGIVLFIRFGHLGIFIAPFLAAWFFAGATLAWWVLQRLGYLNTFWLVMTPAVAMAACGLLSVVYFVFDVYRTERAVHELLQTAAHGSIPTNFELTGTGAEAFRRDATEAVEIRNETESLIGGRWLVWFTGGVGYDLMVEPVMIGKWRVRIIQLPALSPERP